MNASYQRIIARLTEANGLFVPGQVLAAAVGIPVRVLNNWMPTIRAQNGHLVIEGARGKGYRIAGTLGQIAAPATVAVLPRASDEGRIRSRDEGRIRSRPGPKPTGSNQLQPGVPRDQRMAANMAILKLLPKKTAELVKTIAIESGENVDLTLHRLISYGVEVHVDLVALGENPVGLRASTIMPAHQVWQ